MQSSHHVLSLLAILLSARLALSHRIDSLQVAGVVNQGHVSVVLAIELLGHRLRCEGQREYAVSAALRQITKVVAIAVTNV